MKTIRIGSGAGYSGDRIEPAVELAERGRLDYLCFECLAERTIALAQLARLRDPAGGYDPLLVDRMQAVLPAAVRNKVRIVTNMGAANPSGAAAAIAETARRLGISGLKIAAVAGDDVLDQVRDADLPLLETGGRVADLGNRLLSANAYLGAAPIVDALAQGADIVVTGRVADPSLFLAPLIHEFGWAPDDWPLLGQGTVVGHLLECAGQVTGGYFADPGLKDVSDLARLGFPLAEVAADGTAVVTKVEGSGGLVTQATCTEQLIYELHDPTRYLTPDVTADFSGVRFAPDGRDRVRVVGGGGTARPEGYKVSLGYRDGFIGEGQMTYAGPGCVARGRLALAIVAERLKLIGVAADELRFELIGVDSVAGGAAQLLQAEPPEIRIRVAGRTGTLADAVRIGNEVEALYTNGPAAGGGAVKSAREVVAVLSTMLPRERVRPRIQMLSEVPS
ncbi:ABC transporter substrate-binding protein [Aliidongia dinghuensis]|uniref:ABC transporter substrate-binding protein n=1 Tax=Aliidongia dinghuensis TaxID=1867774 RepID=A0A8J3E1M4_9PROT|nr:acyclic terpene utilization AtuA family protein [Aliidongia dinghuensis]GGF02331.1 ABC transporter substrate-binding protein [Aliidongia dinghuensis]